MKLKMRLLTLVGALGLGAGLPSCQTTGATAGTDAVMCPKCKTVWVKRRIHTGSFSKGGLSEKYRHLQAMQCPHCEKAVVTFFKTGQLKHHCSHCDGTMTHCEAR